MAGWPHAKSYSQWLNVEAKTDMSGVSRLLNQYYLILSAVTGIVGLSAPSASLLMTSSWVVQFTHVRERMPEGSWHVWEMSLCEISWSSARPSTRSYTWSGPMSNINTDWRMNGLVVSWQRKIWGYWWVSQKCALAAQEANRIWAVSWEGQQVKAGDFATPLCFGVSPCGVLHPLWGPQYKKDIGLLEWGRGGPQKCSEVWNFSPIRKSRGGGRHLEKILK